MTATFATLISDTERHLLAGDRGQMNALTNAVLATDVDAQGRVTLTFDFALNGIQPGSYVAVDLEMFYVWSTNDNNRSAVCQRGMIASALADHDAGELAFVNPLFSKWDIANAINTAINDLSSPPNGLFQVKTFTLTSQPVQRTYTVPSINTDIISILEVRYQPPGAELPWDRIRRNEFSLMRDMPTTGDGAPSSGMGLRLDRTVYPGRTITVRYAAPFVNLTNMSDNVASVAGISAGQQDIPPLGAASRLMAVREAKRSFAEFEPDSRRAGEVGVGAAARSAQVLRALVDDRVKNEYLQLRAAWPELV